MISDKIKAGKKTFRLLKKKLGSKEKVSEHFRQLVSKRYAKKKKRK